MRKLKKITKFFFSKSVLILLIAMYILAAIVSGVIEYINGASIQVVLFLRGGTVVLDTLLVSLGIYKFTRKWLNKKFLERDFFIKRLFSLAYIAETLAIFFLFYIPYVARSLYLVLYGERIGMPLSTKTFLTNLVLGLSVVIALGAKMKKIMDKLEEKAEQNNFEKEEKKPST